MLVSYLMQLLLNTTTERRNYCYMDNGGCEHVCVPNDNGLRSTCACKEGYTLATDGYSCAGKENENCLVYMYILPQLHGQGRTVALHK